MVYNVAYGDKVRYCLVIETLDLKGQTAPRTEITMDKVILDESLLHHKKSLDTQLLSPRRYFGYPRYFVYQLEHR